MKSITSAVVAGIIALAALVGPVPSAQAQEKVPGVCPTIYVAFDEDDITSLTLGFPNTGLVTVRQDGKACPTGSDDEAIEALKAQIRSGVIDAQDFSGVRRLVPPGRVLGYILPALYTPQYR